MTGPATRLRVDGRLAELTWSRPERRNAIGAELCAGLIEALRSLASWDDVDVVLLRAQTPPFCAGWDTTDFAGLRGASRAEVTAFFGPGRGLLAALGELPQVTVAAPAGAALGFGCALLARCDLVVAADDCVFGLPEIGLGMPPATVLPELLGVLPGRAALRWAVTGELVPAGRAMADGLVTSVVPAGEHEDEVARLAERLCGFAPGAVRATKDLTRRMLAAPDHHERVRIGVAAAIERFLGGDAGGGRKENT